MKKFILKKQKGFTLVELLIVIIIIGILVSIATMKYIDLTEGSKRAVLLSNHQTYIYAAKFYTMTNNKFPTSKEDLSTYIGEVNYDFDGNPSGSTYKIEYNKIVSELKLSNSSETYRVEHVMTR